MFHTNITGLPVRVIATGFQFQASSFFSKAFEFIADLIN
jgi:hypothetical protein